MAVPPSTSSDPAGSPIGQGATGAEPGDPRQAFRSALRGIRPLGSTAIAQAQGLETDAAARRPPWRPCSPGTSIRRRWLRPLWPGSGGSRLALSLFAVTETSVWPFSSLCQALTTLGVEPRSVILALLDRGLIALDTDPDPRPIEDFASRIEQGPPDALDLRVHPSVPQAVRVIRPEGKLMPVRGTVSRIRESDALEPTLRLGAVWQRLGIEPLRQTQQGTLYKRDLERIEGDPVLSGAMSDALEPLPGISALWLALACRVGLIRRDASGERLEAVGPEYWTENAVHLPQMIATSWLGLANLVGMGTQPIRCPEDGPPLPFLRPVLLLWLACLADEEWVALDDLAEHLRVQNPGWDRPAVRPDGETSLPPGRRGSTARGKPTALASAGSRGERVLRALLLGAGYAMGLIRTGIESGSGRTVVQLTAQGRYVLALGPPPPPPTPFEHFLFVQPNLEIIAYRQGLTPQLVGRLSRFAWWTKIGAAMELKLTQESVVLGLEGGLSPEQMIETSGPAQPASPAAAGRRRGRAVGQPARADHVLPGRNPDRVRLSRGARPGFRGMGRQRSPDVHPGRRPVPAGREPATHSDRPDPDQRLPRLSPSSGEVRCHRVRRHHPGARPEPVGPAGRCRTLPVRRRSARSAGPGSGAGAGVRRYVVSPASLARAAELGITSAQIADWFLRRTGEPPSPAIRLLLRSFSSTPTNLTARRILVLTTPTPEIADGLLQHPTTCGLLADRLGPTAIAVPEDHLEALEQVVKDLGLKFQVD